MNLPECAILHSTLGDVCGRLEEFKCDFLAFLEDAVGAATAELSKASEVSLPQTPTLKRGRRPKEVPELAPKDAGDQIARDENPPPSKRALRLKRSSPKLASEGSAETSARRQVRSSTSTHGRINDPTDQPPKEKSRSTQQPATASSETALVLPPPPASLQLTPVDEMVSQPRKKSRSSPKRLTPAKPPRKMRLASQSARKKIGQNYLDENTDPSKLRLESAGVISVVVGSGKGRKYVSTVESEVGKRHQVVQTLVAPVDNVDGGKRRSSSSSTRVTGIRVSQRVKGLQPPEMSRKPVPTMVKGRDTVSPPVKDNQNFRSFVQVSLSPVRAAQMRLPPVTCSPMKVVAATVGCVGHGTYAVVAEPPAQDNVVNDENRNADDDAQLISVGEGTFDVPNTVVAERSSVGGVNRGTFCLPPRKSNVSRVSCASVRRGRLVSRVMARASLSNSMRKSILQMSMTSGDVDSEGAIMELEANVPAVQQTSAIADMSNLNKRLFEEFGLKESVVVIQNCDPNGDLQQQEASKRKVSSSTKDVTLDSGVESAANTASSPMATKKPDEFADDICNSFDQDQEESFASCHSSYSASIISNTPSPTCPSDKVVRPKMVFSSTRKVSQESKTIKGGGASGMKKATNLETALKYFLGGGKKLGTAASVKRLRVQAAVDQSDRVSLVGRTSHIRKPSVSSSAVRTPITQKKRSQGSLLSGTINTPLASKLSRQHTLTVTEQRSEVAAKNREVLMNQRAEEQKRKQDEKNRKLQEALDKKRHLQEEKSKKLKEQEERKHQAALLKKREQEEQKLREQRQEEKRRELERQREQEAEVARQQAAKAERLRERMLEKERIARERDEMERLQAAERAAKENRERLVAAEKSEDAANVSQVVAKQKAALNVTFNNDPPDVCASYDMTPQQVLPLPNADPDNYDIADLKEDSTDDEGQPRKEIPVWATGRRFRIALLEQFRKSVNVTDIFPPAELMRLPHLDKIFKVKKARYNQRGSSADWNTPPIRKISKDK